MSTDAPATVTTPEERDALPRGTVVHSAAGTIAARFDRERGVLFGVAEPFTWANLALPLDVLWRPPTDAAQGRSTR